MYLGLHPRCRFERSIKPCKGESNARPLSRSQCFTADVIETESIEPKKQPCLTCPKPIRFFWTVLDLKGITIAMLIKIKPLFDYDLLAR